MKLELNGDEIAGPITEKLIENSLASLTSDSNSFLILFKDEMTYIQTCKSAGGGFILEYQDGVPEKHFSCIDEMLTIQKVTSAFKSYFHDNDLWKKEFSWKESDFGSATSIPPVVFVAIFAVIVAVVVIIKLI